MDYTPIHEAVSALAGVCNWAADYDGQGFNKPDSWFGHAAASIPASDWDDDMAITARAMIRKYKKQLAGFGIDWDTLPVPPGGDDLDGLSDAFKERARNRVAGIRDAQRRKAESWVRCDGEGERVAISFPYNPALVAELKDWPRSDGRHYNWPDDPRNVFPDKSNDFPFTTLPKVIDFADRHGIDVPAEVRALVAISQMRADESAATPAEATPNVYLDDTGKLCVAADYDPALNADLRDMNRDRSTWVKDRHIHVIPTDSPFRLREIVEKFELTVSEEAREAIENEATRQSTNAYYATQPTINIPMPDFPGLAADQQVKDVQWVAIWWAMTHKRVILGDEMGFGKSLQSLATLAAAGAYPAVVVCRPSLVENWADEVEKFFPYLNVYLATGQDAQVIPGDTDIVVIGSNNLGYTPPVPTWTTADAKKVRTDPLELVKPDRARRAVAYLLTQPGYETTARIAAAATRTVEAKRPSGGVSVSKESVSQRTVEALISGDRTMTQRQIEAALVAIARHAAGKYDAVKRFSWVEAVNRLNPKALIIDEGQDVKEASANRTQAAAMVAEPIVKADGYILNLSGTSILNYVRELCEQLSMMGLIHLFGGRKKFLWRYAVDPAEKAKYHEYGPKYTGSDHLEELHDRLMEWGIMVRRTDPAILGLPAFTAETIDVDPAELDPAAMAEYRQAEDDVVTFLADRARKIAKKLGVDPEDAAVEAAIKAEGAQHLVLLNTLRTAIGKAKRPVAMRWIDRQVAAGEKVVVSADRREEVTAYAKAYGGLRLQGGQSSESKQADKKRFQTDPTAKVISIAIKAGGTGHTLHADGGCNRILQVELTWGPGDEDQLAKRIHRIGQTRPCTAYRLVARTDADGNPLIDSYLDDMVGGKRVTLDAVLNGRFADPEVEDQAEAEVVGDVAWAYTRRGFGGRA